MRRFGTSYFWATLLLPKKIQHQTVELYKFVRIPDQIVDDTPDAEWEVISDKWASLTDFIARRETAYQNKAIDDSLFGEWIKIMYEHDIDPSYTQIFMAAMQQDLTVNRYDSYQQLQWYMHGSAEVVGLMMTDIIWYDQSQREITLAGARKLWEAMQLTNFLRDVYEDYMDLNRIYMPADILAEYGLTHDDVIRYTQTDTIDHKRIAYMKHMIKVCDTMYDEANETIKYLTPSCQSAIIIASDLYRAILRKLESIEYNQFARSATTTRRDKLVVIAKRQFIWKLFVSSMKK